MATLNEKQGEGDFLCVSSCHIGIEESQIWLSLLPLLRLWRSQSPKGMLMVQPCVCVCVEPDSINALAWVVPTILIPEGRMDKTWTSYINTWSNGKWPESRCYPTTGHVWLSNKDSQLQLKLDNRREANLQTSTW